MIILCFITGNETAKKNFIKKCETFFKWYNIGTYDISTLKPIRAAAKQWFRYNPNITETSNDLDFLLSLKKNCDDYVNLSTQFIYEQLNNVKYPFCENKIIFIHIYNEQELVDLNLKLTNEESILTTTTVGVVSDEDSTLINYPLTFVCSDNFNSIVDEFKKFLNFTLYYFIGNDIKSLFIRGV